MNPCADLKFIVMPGVNQTVLILDPIAIQLLLRDGDGLCLLQTIHHKEPILPISVIRHLQPVFYNKLPPVSLVPYLIEKISAVQFGHRHLL